MEQRQSGVQASYDRVAKEYARRLYDELDKKPFDRRMLAWLADKVGQAGVICDMGCGPGQIANYLHCCGVPVCGVDLSREMIQQARHLNPAISFQQGDMLALTDVADSTYGGIAAFYCIIHIPRSAVVTALQEWWRVLVPQGVLLLTFHLGRHINHLDEWWGQPVSLDFIFFEREEMKEYVRAAGFAIEEVIERDPYPDVEVQTRRAYLFARKP